MIGIEVKNWNESVHKCVLTMTEQITKSDDERVYGLCDDVMNSRSFKLNASLDLSK